MIATCGIFSVTVARIHCDPTVETRNQSTQGSGWEQPASRPCTTFRADLVNAGSKRPRILHGRGGREPIYSQSKLPAHCA